MPSLPWKAPVVVKHVDGHIQEPAQLTLIRRGVYLGSKEPLVRSMRGVHQQHQERLGNEKEFKVVVVQKAEALVQSGGAPGFPLPVGSLTPCQMQALVAYTTEKPPYFLELSQLLNEGQHPDARLQAWQELLFQLETGLKPLQSSGHAAPALRCAAVVPLAQAEVFQPGREVLFPSATLTTPQMSSSAPVMPPGEAGSIPGGGEVTSPLAMLVRPNTEKTHKCILLEFDEAAGREAAFVGGVTGADEWLLPFGFRAIVLAVEEEDRDFQQVMKVTLRGLRRLQQLPAILDWSSGISVGQLLGLAVTLEAHCAGDVPSLALASTLLICEGLARHLKRQLLKQKSKSDSALAKLLAPLVGGGRALVSGWADVWREKLGEAAESFWEERTKDPIWSLRQFSVNLAALQLENVIGLAHEDSSPQRLAYVLAQEDRSLKRLAYMLLEANDIEDVLSDFLSTTAQDLQLPWLPSSPYLLQHQVGSRRRLLSPVVSSIVGLPEVHELNPHAGASLKAPSDVLLLAALDLLRQRLSTTRVVVPLGLPDSGKSTILRNAFNIDVAEGLLDEGRTKSLVFHPFPACDLDHSEVLIGDVPGFGDAVAARNQVVRVMCHFALDEKLKEMMLTLLVLRSGRDTQSVLEGLVSKLSFADAEFLVLFTHADKVFADYHRECPKGRKKSDPLWLQECAVRIKEEDRQRLARQLPGKSPKVFYTCFAGQMAWQDDGVELEDEEDGMSPKSWLLKSFHGNFHEVLRTPSQVRREVLSHFGLSGS